MSKATNPSAGSAMAPQVQDKDLVVIDLTVEYPSGDYVIRPLDRFSMRAADGSLVLLNGPSGCGKTTLLSCLGAMLVPAGGSIRHGDTDITSLSGAQLTDFRRHGVGIVFQAFNLVPSLIALENVMVPLRAAGVPRARARERATELLRRVGLSERMHHRPGDLSGGQQQRVAIARALALDPPLLLADEPTAHLDYIQVEGVLRLIRSLAEPGRVVVVSTHDDRMLPLADQVIELAPRAGLDVVSPWTLELADGQTLFEQGSMGNHVFVVEGGAIRLTRRRPDGSEEELAVVEPPGYFGEMGPLFQLPRSATARAVGNTSITGYTVRDFRTLQVIDRSSNEPVL
ncbi:MAG TPA: ATP-binding cassette domain-containing protein [Acidimicrobiales bacterium]